MLSYFSSSRLAANKSSVDKAQSHTSRRDKSSSKSLICRGVDRGQSGHCQESNRKKYTVLARDLWFRDIDYMSLMPITRQFTIFSAVGIVATLVHYSVLIFSCGGRSSCACRLPMSLAMSSAVLSLIILTGIELFKVAVRMARRFGASRPWQRVDFCSRGVLRFFFTDFSACHLYSLRH